MRQPPADQVLARACPTPLFFVYVSATISAAARLRSPSARLPLIPRAVPRLCPYLCFLLLGFHARSVTATRRGDDKLTAHTHFASTSSPIKRLSTNRIKSSARPFVARWPCLPRLLAPRRHSAQPPRSSAPRPCLDPTRARTLRSGRRCSPLGASRARWKSSRVTSKSCECRWASGPSSVRLERGPLRLAWPSIALPPLLSSTWRAALTLANVAPSTAINGSLGTSLISGGTVAILWGWVIVALLILVVAASLAEMCSAWPHAAGQALWSFQLAPPRWAPFLSFWTGWMNIAGGWALIAAGAYILADGILALAMAYHPTYAVQSWHLVLVYILALVVFFVVNVRRLSSAAPPPYIPGLTSHTRAALHREGPRLNDERVRRRESLVRRRNHHCARRVRAGQAVTLVCLHKRRLAQRNRMVQQRLRVPAGPPAERLRLRGYRGERPLVRGGARRRP